MKDDGCCIRQYELRGFTVKMCVEEGIGVFWKVYTPDGTLVYQSECQLSILKWTRIHKNKYIKKEGT